ncbi:MAG: aminoglycoside phosphotransferase family protein [Betaproteobacteria bacterium]|nr:aminoglycoside phosphotransferase family protein [Betaproteobacteria bacterium]
MADEENADHSGTDAEGAVAMTPDQHLPAIDVALVDALVQDQFPQWAELPISPVLDQGWDNRTFRLGEYLSVRMPSAAAYAAQVHKEQQWLPFLASQLDAAIPRPVGFGVPGRGYPWSWSIHQWIAGERASSRALSRSVSFAQAAATFLRALRNVPRKNGPTPGEHNFQRGGPLRFCDAEFREAAVLLQGGFDARLLQQAWADAVDSIWHFEPVWIHGDFAPSNLIVNDAGALAGIIDFGQTGIGDPACDLAIAWSYFREPARTSFLECAGLDRETCLRGRAWALWKAAIVESGLCTTTDSESRVAAHTLLEIESEVKTERP